MPRGTDDVEPPGTSSLLDLGGRVALVTGAGRGIGAGIARRFAEAGASVAVNYRSSRDRAAAVVAEIEAEGGRAVALRADVARAEEVERLVQGTLEALGHLDVLVNNAGAYPLSPLLEMAPGEWDAVLDANLRGAFLCTRAAGRRMSEGGRGGAIVNVASIEGLAPMPLHAHYNAAKAGLLMLTRSAAAELGPRGIRVNAVSPGLIGREGIEEEWPEGVARWKEACPLERLGGAEDVADACLFLASPGARWISGANLVVDGGAMTRGIF